MWMFMTRSIPASMAVSFSSTAVNSTTSGGFERAQRGKEEFRIADCGLQKTEVGGQRPEIRGQKTEISNVELRIAKGKVESDER